jgi:hypothetical protein
VEKLQLAITLSDGQTFSAELRPEDERRLAELLGDRTTIQLASNDDLEGHAISGEVFADVEGHAMALRLPRPADAAALRRALAVGAVTATIVGAGVIAGLQTPAQTTTPAVEVPAVRQQVQTVPAAALRAQQNEMTREQNLQAVPLDVENPAVPAQALHAETNELSVPAAAVSAQQDELTRQQNQAVPLDADNPAVPAQALHAERNGQP